MKRIFAGILGLLIIISTLSACSKSKTYLQEYVKCYSEDNTLLYTVTYNYDTNGNLLTETGSYEYDSTLNYSKTFNYDEKENIISLISLENNAETVYTAEKITNYKYLFTSEDGFELTLIFDKQGHIVSNKTSEGYVCEYAYTYSKTGKPVSVKKQIIHPSGSSKLFEYTVEFTGKDTYNFYDVEDQSYYFSVKCKII